MDLSEFNTTNVTDMEVMFSCCHQLKSIKGINNFITTNVLNIKGMFKQCNTLENLDLSKFNIINVTHLGGMFLYPDKLKEIKGITVILGVIRHTVSFVTPKISKFSSSDE